jgi:hypothetical protein
MTGFPGSAITPVFLMTVGVIRRTVGLDGTPPPTGSLKATVVARNDRL